MRTGPGLLGVGGGRGRGKIESLGITSGCTVCLSRQVDCLVVPAGGYTGGEFGWQWLGRWRVRRRAAKSSTFRAAAEWTAGATEKIGQGWTRPRVPRGKAAKSRQRRIFSAGIRCRIWRGDEQEAAQARPAQCAPTRGRLSSSAMGYSTNRQQTQVQISGQLGAEHRWGGGGGCPYLARYR